jgi:hypothetical protein
MVQKKYQVFVSSTFRDLKEERQEVMQAILELKCIPSGMELFPAANDDQWGLIKQVIDDCDYYLVIVGGRYGSMTPEGMSYTQKEYEYADSLGKPILGFLHEKPEMIPFVKSEGDPVLREKLSAFRAVCEARRVCKYWNSAPDLGAKVSRSLINLINSYPAVGWVRGDRVPDESTAETINRLREEIDRLKGELDRVRQEPPPGAERLAQGMDVVWLGFTAKEEFSSEDAKQESLPMTWDDLFASVGPCMIDEASEYKLLIRLEEVIRNKCRLDDHLKVNIDRLAFDKILVQFHALGLICLSETKRGVKHKGTAFWRLTPYGMGHMHRLVACARPTAVGSPSDKEPTTR